MTSVFSPNLSQTNQNPLLKPAVCFKDTVRAAGTLSLILKSMEKWKKTVLTALW
jgi:hypothetical protein